jgi:hypothetical protein
MKKNIETQLNYQKVEQLEMEQEIHKIIKLLVPDDRFVKDWYNRVCPGTKQIPNEMIKTKQGTEELLKFLREMKEVLNYGGFS